MKLLLKLWIKIKIAHAKKKGWIHGVLAEKQLIKQIDAKGIYNLNYKIDRLGKLLWDYQFDAIETCRRGGADCNSINRCWQVYYSLFGFESYLVTFLHKPLSKENYYRYLKRQGIKHSFITVILNWLGVLSAHTTTIIFKNDKYNCCDYGQALPSEDNFNDALKRIESKYNLKIKSYIVQDIEFDFVRGF